MTALVYRFVPSLSKSKTTGTTLPVNQPTTEIHPFEKLITLLFSSPLQDTSVQITTVCFSTRQSERHLTKDDRQTTDS